MARDTVRQLALPGIDMRPICPGCKQFQSPLGQVYPERPFALCRSCTQALAPDMATLEHFDDFSRLRHRSDSAWEQRARYQWHISALARLHRGCIYPVSTIIDGIGLPCQDQQIDHLECRACRNRMRYETRIHMMTKRMSPWNDRLAQSSLLALCERCGNPHSRLTITGNPATYCQRCDDEIVVETIARWLPRMQPHLVDDDEGALDWIYQTSNYRDLFNRGVLPDYWYKVRRER